MRLPANTCPGHPSDSGINFYHGDPDECWGDRPDPYPYRRSASMPSDPYPILAYFSYGHLPLPLQAISKPLALIAQEMVATLPPGPEVSAGLRKLLEAKDCFVRAALPVAPPAPKTP